MGTISYGRLRKILLLTALLTVQFVISMPAHAAPSTITDPNFTAPILDGQAQFRNIAFKNPVPNALNPAFIYRPGSDEPDTGLLEPNHILEPGVDWYDISMREIHHHIAGLIDDSTGQLLPPFVVRAYGPTHPSTFPYLNTYPGRTIDARRGTPVKVEWVNELGLDPNDPNSRPQNRFFLPVDKTIMCGPAGYIMPWNCPVNAAVVHVHGSHGYDHSDGIPDQWFAPGPNAGQENAYPGLVGSLWRPNNQMGGWPVNGSASPVNTFVYPVDQEAATLWYHDHATSITRLNAMAGLAGFFLIRDNNEIAMQNTNPPGLPKYPYEIPIAVQDHIFWGADAPDPVDPTNPNSAAAPRLGQMAAPNALLTVNGSPVTLPNGQLTPTIIPEFFGNVILVNGVAWPKLDVEPRKYRVRILNANDSRTMILQLADPGNAVTGTPPAPNGDPITIIGTEQGFLNSPINVQQLVIMPGMRYDVIIDFAKYAGTNRQIILQNVGPDAPYDGTAPVANDPGGYIPADPFSTGQIMAFNVVLPLDTTVPDAVLPTNLRAGYATAQNPTGQYPAVPVVPAGTKVSKSFLKEIVEAPVPPFQDSFGRVQLTINFKSFTDPVTELPVLGTTQVWEIANLTPDAHPMHLHLARFRIVNREQIASVNGVAPFTPAIPAPLPQPTPVWTGTGILELANPQETGFLDTVVCPPGYMTRIVATFDIPGLYVWHCHILHHEEFDMMRPLAVVTPAKAVTLTSNYTGKTLPIPAQGETPPLITFTATAATGLTGTLRGNGVPAPATTLAYEYQFTVKNPDGTSQLLQPWSTKNTFTIGGTTGNYPNAPGTWYLQADARAMGSTSRQASAVIGTTASYPAPVGLTLTGPSATSQPAGARIPVTYTATGLSALPSTAGPGPYEYQFSLRLNNSATQVVQPYLDQANGNRNPGTWTWTPAADQAPGLYYVQADIRTAGTTAPRMYTKILSYSIVGPKPVGVTLTSSSTQQPAATASPVTFTAAGLSALPNTVGPGPYEYQFWLKNALGQLQLVQSWSQNPAWVWTPPNIPGQYSVEVDARAVGGVVKDALKTMTYKLLAP